jgi:hypothetical protein
MTYEEIINLLDNKELSVRSICGMWSVSGKYKNNSVCAAHEVWWSALELLKKEVERGIYYQGDCPRPVPTKAQQPVAEEKVQYLSQEIINLEMQYQKRVEENYELNKKLIEKEKNITEINNVLISSTDTIYNRNKEIRRLQELVTVRGDAADKLRDKYPSIYKDIYIPLYEESSKEIK